VLYPFGDLPDSLSPCDNIRLQGPKSNRTWILKERGLNATPDSENSSTKAGVNVAEQKKGALSSSEDESAPCVGKIPGAKMQIHLFGNPAILLGKDPWLCVTRLLWLCPFGERFLLINPSLSLMAKNSNFFCGAHNSFHQVSEQAKPRGAVRSSLHSCVPISTSKT
jgi:hypothetical protein